MGPLARTGKAAELILFDEMMIDRDAMWQVPSLWPSLRDGRPRGGLLRMRSEVGCSLESGSSVWHAREGNAACSRSRVLSPTRQLSPLYCKGSPHDRPFRHRSAGCRRG